MLCSVPWLTSGWYGVYAVYHSPRNSSWSTTGGLQWRYAPAPRNDARSTRLRPASVSRRAVSSSSGTGSGRRSGEARRSAGISANRSSTLPTPIVASIRARSGSVWGPHGIGRSALRDQLLVRRGVEQRIHLGRIGHRDLEHP